MTPKQFEMAMRLILRSDDTHQIAASAVKLISEELGAGMIPYIPSLVRLSDRMRELRGRENAMQVVIDKYVETTNVVEFPQRKK